MKRITMKSGKLTKRLVITAPPYPNVGDILQLGTSTTGAEWSVTKVVEAGDGMLVNLPKATAGVYQR